MTGTGAGTAAAAATAPEAGSGSGAGSGRKRPRRDPLGTFGDFLPWILYWVLVGNVAFRTALLVAVLAAAAVLLLHRATDGSWRTLPVGSFVVFVVLGIIALVVDDDALERWLQPLSNLGLLLIVVGGMAVGRPFTLDYARDSVAPEMASSKGFLWVNQRLTAIWAGAFLVMTVSSFVPPLVEGDATIRDAGHTLSVVGYWVVPFAAMGLAALATMVLVRGMGDDAPAPTGEPAPGSGLPTPAPVEAAGGLGLVVPDAVAADGPLPIRVEGVPDGGRVDLVVTLVDALNRRFTSRATFAASGGVVDTSVHVPTGGDWAAADAGAAVWSAQWAEAGPPDLFLPSWGPMSVLVEATAGDRGAARTVVRSGLATGVRVVEVRDGGLVGRAFLPGGPAVPVPGVVLVGGSEGGVDSMSAMAAGLASHGVGALVVGLFGAPGLPDQLREVPLEPIAEGSAWLAARPEVDGDRVALLGLSRGSEAVLAAASLIDGLTPGLVVGLSPGSTVWEALTDDGTGTGCSSWTVAGRPLPFASVDDVAVTRDLFAQALRRGLHRDLPQRMHLRAAYEGGLAAPAAAAAAIPVERIAGRVVLHAPGADALWPSDVMARAVVERRRAAGREGDELTVHPGAGHLLRWPVVPVRPAELDGLVFGGDPAGQAAAHAALAPALVAALTR